MLKLVLGYVAGLFLFVFSADVTVNLSLALWQSQAGFGKFDLKVVLGRLWYAELIALHIV